MLTPCNMQAVVLALMLNTRSAMAGLKERCRDSLHQLDDARNRLTRHSSVLQRNLKQQQHYPSATAVVGMVGLASLLVPAEGFLSFPSLKSMPLVMMRHRRSVTGGLKRIGECATERTMLPLVQAVASGSAKHVAEGTSSASLGEAVRPDFPILDQVSLL